MIFLNNAYTTAVKPERVKSAPPADAETAKLKLAELFHMKKPENIIFTHDEFQAMDIVLRSLIGPGDHVISTVMEQSSTVSVLDDLTAEGAEVTYIGVNSYGRLKYENIEGAIKDNTRFMVVSHGSNVTGNINDMEIIGTIARRHKLMVICDGSQTAGACEINLETLGADVFCFAGHKKLMGPYGIGGICLRDGLTIDSKLVDSIGEIKPEIYGGFCAALDFIREKGIYGISIFPHRLAKRFFESVQSMDKVKVFGDFGTGVRIPTVTIQVEGFTPEEVKLHMRKNGIAVKSGLFEAPMLMEAMGTPDGLTRFSFGYFNTRRDVNDAIWVLMDLLGLDDLYLLA